MGHWRVCSLVQTHGPLGLRRAEPMGARGLDAHIMQHFELGQLHSISYVAARSRLDLRVRLVVVEFEIGQNFIHQSTTN